MTTPSGQTPLAEKMVPAWAETVSQRLAAPVGRRARYRRFSPELCYGRHRGPAGADAKLAAVVVLLYPYHGPWHLPLVLRPAWMSAHASQISLPGGRAEPGERLQVCALRELHEELGVEPARVHVLGSLPLIHVYASNFLVEPFLAITPERPAFRPDAREVSELLELPVAHLADRQNHETHTIVRGPLSFQAPCIVFQSRHIWGATALILGEFLNVIEEAQAGRSFA